MFSGKTAFITGGARGLGKGIAKGILEGGGKVVLTDLLESLGQDTAKELGSQYGSTSVFFIHCDVTNKTQFQDAFQKAVDLTGSIDVMVNNAGILTHEDFEVTININLTAVIRGSFLALEHMRNDKGGKGGSIINIASKSGLESFPTLPVYRATKYGVVGFSRGLGEGVVEQGVCVMCLCPGYTRTAMLDKVLEIDKNKEDVMASGVIEVGDVFKAFEVLVKDNMPGSVMVVSPKGSEYHFTQS